MDYIVTTVIEGFGTHTKRLSSHEAAETYVAALRTRKRKLHRVTIRSDEEQQAYLASRPTMTEVVDSYDD